MSMENQFSRTQMLLGERAIEKLSCAKVAVFGVGGVGGYVVEALARCGVGEFELIDNDTIAPSNLNRQIIATHKTIGHYKVDVMKERILDINPDVKVSVRKCFFLPETASEFSFSEYDYVVDAIDTVTAKIELVMQAKAANVPIISSMGTGNKLDGSLLQIADISKTKMCPLAKVMRRELKKRGVTKLKVVYSEEKPIQVDSQEVNKELMTCESASQQIGTVTKRRSVPGSVSFVPSVAGLLIAGEVVKDLI